MSGSGLRVCTHPPLILLHHGVARVSERRDPAWLCTPPTRLERQLRVLIEWGYELVSFGELARRARSGLARGCAALTFDDGFANNLTTLAPLLDRFGATATVFVVSGWLGNPHPDAPAEWILTAEEVRALDERGIEVGAHTVSHPDLTALDHRAARAELAASKRALEEIVEHPVLVAAYPYGRANDETKRACRDAGFAAACVMQTGSWLDPYALPRQVMNTYSSIMGLRLKRDDRYESLMRLPLARAARKLRRMTVRALS